jgi:hypothetical protein
MEEYSVYNKSQFDFEDIFALLVHNFVWNMYSDLYKMCYSGFKNGKYIWFYECNFVVTENRM